MYCKNFRMGRYGLWNGGGLVALAVPARLSIRPVFFPFSYR